MNTDVKGKSSSRMNDFTARISELDVIDLSVNEGVVGLVHRDVKQETYVKTYVIKDGQLDGGESVSVPDAQLIVAVNGGFAVLASSGCVFYDYTLRTRSSQSFPRSMICKWFVDFNSAQRQ